MVALRRHSPTAKDYSWAKEKDLHTWLKETETFKRPERTWRQRTLSLGFLLGAVACATVAYGYSDTTWALIVFSVLAVFSLGLCLFPLAQAVVSKGEHHAHRKHLLAEIERRTSGKHG